MLVNELHQGGIRALIDWDSTIFDNMVLPDDVELADVVDHILYKYGDAPLFSPDPSVVKFYIGRWSKRRLPLWERYKTAIEIEYAPLENYDRTEERTENRTGTRDNTGTIDTDDTGTVGTVIAGSITDQRAADNSENWSNYDKSIEDTTNTTTNNLTRSEERNLTEDSEEDTTINSRVHGNIGVTTSQQMLAAELDIVPRLDLIDFIADDWHAEFNMMIYV